MRIRAFLVLCAVLLIAPAAAHADRDFANRFALSTHGDIRIVGNKLHDCPGDAGCQEARDTFSTTYFNNDHAMVQLDVDSDAATFNSSRATLDLPAGAEVRFAGLYWGATLSGTEGPTPAEAPDERGTVRFDPPGAGGYESVAATTLETTIGTDEFYGGFADVTARVSSAGEGSYTVADVQSSTGKSDGGRLDAHRRLRGRRRAAAQPDGVRRLHVHAQPVDHPGDLRASALLRTAPCGRASARWPTRASRTPPPRRARRSPSTGRTSATR